MGKPLYWSDVIGQGKSRFYQDEVDNYMKATTWDYPGFTPEILESLAVALRDEGPWTPVASDPPPDLSTLMVWNKRVGEWSMVLVDFPLDGQGRPGEHGQNITMRHAGSNTTIMSDGKLQHDLARWMVDRMKVKQA